MEELTEVLDMATFRNTALYLFDPGPLETSP